MGLSIRARQIARAMAAERAAERRARDEAEAAERRAVLSRREAAAYLGISSGTLRDWWIEGRGPAGIKRGTSRQARIYYRVEELDRWLADPVNYNTPARPAGTPRFTPPRREAGTP